MLIHAPKKKFWIPQSPALWMKAAGGGGGTTPTRIQGNLHSNGASSSTTCSVTLGAAVGSGHGVLVACGTASTSGGIISSVTDDKSNTYTLETTGIGSGFSWAGAFLLNATNGPSVITMNLGSAQAFSTIIVTEFSNLLTGGFDGYQINANQAGSATTNAITSNTITTTAAGDLIWGACVNLSGSSTLVKGTAFTADQNSGSDFVTEYLIQGSAGAQAALLTGTAADTFTTFVMGFKHA